MLAHHWFSSCLVLSTDMGFTCEPVPQNAAQDLSAHAEAERTTTIKQRCTLHMVQYNQGPVSNYPTKLTALQVLVVLVPNIHLPTPQVSENHMPFFLSSTWSFPPRSTRRWSAACDPLLVSPQIGNGLLYSGPRNRRIRSVQSYSYVKPIHSAQGLAVGLANVLSFIGSEIWSFCESSPRMYCSIVQPT